MTSLTATSTVLYVITAHIYGKLWSRRREGADYEKHARRQRVNEVYCGGSNLGKDHNVGNF